MLLLKMERILWLVFQPKVKTMPAITFYENYRELTNFGTLPITYNPVFYAGPFQLQSHGGHTASLQRDWLGIPAWRYSAGKQEYTISQ